MPYRLNAFTGDFDLVLDSVNGAVTTQFDTDSGSALPTAGGVITISGGTGLNTSGAANTVTINLDDPVIVDNGGTGRTSLTDGAILVGDGSNPVEFVGPLTDGQLLIGDTAGVSPVAATLTAGTGISISNAAGSITINSGSSVPTTFQTDSGTATPALNILTCSGSGLVDTSGAGSTLTINVDSPVVVSNGGTGVTSLTDGGILLGSGTSPVTATSQPTNGQLLIGSTGVDPVLASLTSSGSTIDITNGAGSINLETGTAVLVSVTTDSGSAVPSSGILTATGGTLLGTTGAGSTLTINADDNVVGSVVSDSGTATPTSNAFTIAGSGSVSTSASGSTVTIAVSGSGLSWNVETGTSANMAVNNGYIGNNAAGVTFTLPASAAVGETIQVTGLQDSWTIAQNAGQTIYFGSSSTTTGVGGSLASTDARDVIELICVVGNTDFQVISSIGNITVV